MTHLKFTMHASAANLRLQGPLQHGTALVLFHGSFKWQSTELEVPLITEETIVRSSHAILTLHGSSLSW